MSEIPSSVLGRVAEEGGMAASYSIARLFAICLRLRRIIDSEVRLVRIGTYDDWVDTDEGFCEAAKRALARIEADLVATQ